MEEKDFKKLLDKSLKPIKEDLHGVKEDLHGVKEDLHGVKEDLRGVKVDLHKVKEDLKGIEEDISILKASVINIETTNGIYGDMYKRNNDNAKKLEKRLESVEQNAGIQPPPELILAEVN